MALAIRNKSNRATRLILERASDWTHIIDGVHGVLSRVNAALADPESTGPDPMPYDPVWCDGCDAKAICPNMERLQGRGNIQVQVSKELDLHCQSMLALEHAAKAHGRAKTQVKKYAEGLGLYQASEVGSIRTVVTDQHRVSVEHKGNGRYITIVPLAGDEEESEV